jgi:hypothetical protein
MGHAFRAVEIESDNFISAGGRGRDDFDNQSRHYRFRDKPQRIRFRILDRRHALLPGDPVQDITLDARGFARIDRRLNAEEGALYDDLRDNRLCRNLRREQEQIGFGRVKAALAALA